MNTTDTNITIAEELGVMRWSYLDGRRYPDTLRYTEDLDAMHQAIMSLTLEDQCDMTEYLRKEVLKFAAPTITATAAQLAEAFLNFRDHPKPESATLVRLRAAAVRRLDAVKHCFDKMNSEEMAADHRMRHTAPADWSVADMNLIIGASLTASTTQSGKSRPS